MDLEDKGEGRRHGGRVLCGSGGNKKGGMRKMTAGEWAYIQLSHATAHGATQSRQSMWRDSALPRHPQHRACASVAACHAKACGVTPRNLARPKGLVFANLDLYELFIKY